MILPTSMLGRAITEESLDVVADALLDFAEYVYHRTGSITIPRGISHLLLTHTKSLPLPEVAAAEVRVWIERQLADTTPREIVMPRTVATCILLAVLSNRPPVIYRHWLGDLIRGMGADPLTERRLRSVLPGCHCPRCSHKKNSRKPAAHFGKGA